MTGFDKTTSNSSTLTTCNLTNQYAIHLQFSQNSSIALCNKKSNLKVIAYSYIEVWFFEVTNLDVCGILVLSNPVTLILCLAIILMQYLCVAHTRMNAVPMASDVDNKSFLLS